MRESLRCLLLWALTSSCFGQTTQGIITGQITDAFEGSPLPGAKVTATHLPSGIVRVAITNEAGSYFLPLLSPGNYFIRSEAGAGYQAKEVHQLELAVSASLKLDLRLRPADDVWEQQEHQSFFLPDRTTLVFFGPDVDTSRASSFEPPKSFQGAFETTVSNVVDSAQIRDLPLAGRDVYTLLAIQPGVTSDAGTARGLGLSVNGQRPSASNFLLDGLENNNYLITGPLMAVAPEAVQEYRFSTNNFSAEYGRTAGFVANVVTRSGGVEWHGVGYFYLKNDALSANDFQRNRLRQPRAPLKDAQPGFSVGGPLLRPGLFASGAFEYYRFRSLDDAKPYQFASASSLETIRSGTLALGLIRDFPPPASGRVDLRQPTSLQRYLALPRFDAVWGDGKQHWMARAGIARLERPDFIWSPYPGFSSPLTQSIFSPALTGVATLPARLTLESRIGWSSDDLRWDRAHPDVPQLISFCNQPESPACYAYPGSPAFYSYRNRSRSWELAQNLVGAAGRHVWKAGGGFLLRRLDGYLTAGLGGQYYFPKFTDFAMDHPTVVVAAATRPLMAPLKARDYSREYGYNQFFGYAQDSFKVTSRLVLNAGVRYENFGTPRNTGPMKDLLLELGPGGAGDRQLTGLGYAAIPNGDQRLYAADNNDWAGRAGISCSLRGDGRTVARASYGEFYDRPFDNLWQNLRSNSFGFGLAAIGQATTPYLQPAGQVAFPLPGFKLDNSSVVSRLTLYQPGIRSSYVHSYFGGVEQRVTSALTVEVDALGSLGHKGLTTDRLNRFGIVNGRIARPNSKFPDIYYRANQGSSSYQALAAVARFRPRRGQMQLSYTWSHSIDNQSEALAGEYFDLRAEDPSYARIALPVQGPAGFTHPLDSGGDRASSNFDQRHNLVFFSVWELPPLGTGSPAAALWRGWKVSQLAAFRSGYPFTVNADPVANVGARLVKNVDGGKQMLNPLAFTEPQGVTGTLGRNRFTGPGTFNTDVSVSRSFSLHRLGEAGRLTLRADAFNFLNHANLNNPSSLDWGSVDKDENRAVAFYGRKGAASTFPALAPFVETARQIQILLRVEF